ncbi:hypothetical protein TDB9533_04655 [Thalassocella blandensis]|nr:hypothetical protein TDB9533_04655 [Thalassocella blandensis]
MKPAFWVAALYFALTGILSGCSTTYRAEFVEKTTKYGSNPYIQAPHVKDLEQRILNILLADRLTGPEYNTKFDPRNKAILDNFSNLYNHAELVSNITLVSQGFDYAVAKSYPQIGNDSKCGVSKEKTYFFNTDDEPTEFDWKFVQGTCIDGLAEGIARLQSTTSEGQFVGRMENGELKDGIFTMLRQDETRVIQIGGIANEKHNARMLWTKIQPNGYRWHLYGDLNNHGQFDGFGINIWGYVNLLHVYEVGQYKKDKLNGFVATQRSRDWAEGKLWDVTLGFFKDGNMHGWIAWTDTVDDITISEWKDDVKHGIGYSADFDIYNNIYTFDVGKFVDGERHGSFYNTNYGYFGKTETTDVYDHGTRIEKPGGGFDWGKAIALTAGAAVIGSADIDTASMVEIGGAFASDIINETGGTNMQGLQNAYQSRLNSTQTSSDPSSPSGQSNGQSEDSPKLNEFDTTITCPDTGVTTDITIPYRTEACRVAALDFAKTFACNQTDQDRVTSNCQSACGHPQCLQQ